MLFSDGGGYHNVIFLFVQCMLLALCRILDVDIVNVGRCGQNQPFINPAERFMSIPNIEMQGLALERDRLGPFETVIKSCKSMKEIRAKATKHQGLSEAYQTSLETSRKVLKSSFQAIEL